MSDNLIHALAGAGGGIFSLAATYPLVTVSSRLQVQRTNPEATKYDGNVDAFKKILSKEGIPGLFSGLESAVFGAAVTNGVYYYFFESVRKRFMELSNSKNMNIKESLITGAIAGAMTTIITNPIWVVNTRAMVREKSASQKSSKSTFQELKEIIKTDGLASLWQGIAPALILVINPVIQYTVFEQIKNKIEKTKSMGNLDFFILGAFSKLVATSITYPYIVVKSRMQMRQSKDDSQRYTSVIDGFKKIISTEGIKGLYNGIESKLLQSVLTAALLFMSKEALYKLALKVTMISSIISSSCKDKIYPILNYKKTFSNLSLTTSLYRNSTKHKNIPINTFHSKALSNKHEIPIAIKINSSVVINTTKKSHLYTDNGINDNNHEENNHNNKKPDEPKTHNMQLEAFKTLIKELSKSLKANQTPSSYMQAMDRGTLMVSDNENPELKVKEDDEGKKLILKRRPWRYRYPKPQRYYEPGGLTGIEWEIYDKQYSENAEASTANQLNNSDTNSDQIDTNRDGTFIQKSVADYYSFRKNIVNPNTLLDTLLKTKESRASNSTNTESTLWEGEDIEFANEINKLLSQKESPEIQNTNLQINYDDINQTTNNSDHDVSKNNTLNFKNNNKSQISEFINRNAKNFKNSSNQKPKKSMDFDHTDKKKFSTLQILHSLGKQTCRSYSAVPQEKEQIRVEKIKPFKKTKLISRIKTGPKKAKKDQISKTIADYTRKFRGCTFTKVIGSHKILIVDQEMESDIYSDSKRLPEPGDLAQPKPFSKNNIRSPITNFGGVSVVVSKTMGRFRYDIVFEKGDNTGATASNIGLCSPKHCLRTSVLLSAGVRKPDIRVIKRWENGEGDEFITTKNGEIVTIDDFSKTIFSKYGSPIISQFVSSVNEILWSTDLDPKTYWESLVSMKKETISIDECALMLLEMNQNPLPNVYQPKNYNADNIPQNNEIVNLLSKYPSTFEPLNIQEFDYVVDVIFWEMLKFAANEFLGRNSKYFFTITSESLFTREYRIQDEREIKEVETVEKWANFQTPEYKSFLEKSKFLLAKSFKQNPMLSESFIDPKIEKEQISLYDSRLNDYTNKLEKMDSIEFSNSDLKIISILKKYSFYSNFGYKDCANIYNEIVVSILKPIKIFNTIDFASVMFFLSRIGVWPHYKNVKIYDPILSLAGTGISPKIDDLTKKCNEWISKNCVSQETNSFGSNSILIKSQNNPVNSTKNISKPLGKYNELNENEFYSRDPCESIRHDFGNMPVYTIDSESTTDVDDGISIEKIKNSAGVEEIWVHIHVADPTRLLHPNHIISKLAKSKLSSIYFAEFTQHMLPAPWAIDEFSLVSSNSKENGKPKYAITASVLLGENGDIADYRIRASILRNIKRLSYDMVNDVIPFDYVPGGRQKYESIKSNAIAVPSIVTGKIAEEQNNKSIGELDNQAINDLNELHDLHRKHFDYRIECGALVHDMPDPNVAVSGLKYTNETTNLDGNEFGSKGFHYLDFDGGETDYGLNTNINNLNYPQIVLGTDISSISPAHIMVAEYMVIAGRAVSRFAVDNNFPVVFRSQQKPDFESVDSSMFTFKSSIPEYSDLTLDELKEKVSPEEFWNTTTKHLNKQTGKLFIKYYDEIRYLMNSAAISTSPGPHSTLGIIDKYGYCRFTSPIRRYIDLVCHWQVKHQLLVNSGLAKQEDIPFDNEKLEKTMENLRYWETGIRNVGKDSIMIWALKAIQRVEYVSRRINRKPDLNQNEPFWNLHDFENFVGSKFIENTRFVSVDEYLKRQKENTLSLPGNWSIPGTKLASEVENTSGWVPVWRVVVSNRDTSRGFISVYFKELGVRAMMDPVPADPEKFPYAGEEFDVVVTELEPNEVKIKVTRVF
ncbi:hypothetical protein BB559_005774 [Furculomyces boomerangus]|uniref:RNB domain-containing protein n=1 Tax=Furculomyces boomerangus TaxID=61424 RepID=A0A2T9Y6S8_9FUNG|nr:hypothetical protein BB559_005774 [Furculomyces boomerangus]